MLELTILTGLLLGLGLLAAYWRNSRVRALARQRLDAATATPAATEAPVQPAHPYLKRHHVLPWVCGLAVAALLHFAFGWAAPFVLAVALIVSLELGQLEAFLAAGRTAKIETQLADAIDLMVAALQAGASVGDALENAVSEARKPLRPQLEEVVGRIRFGEQPRTAYQGLTERVPLETFLLFSSALSVQSETGGSLAPTLSSVGRTIRDRIEMARRIRSNSSQSEVSTVAVLFLTYFIAVIVWRTNPEQMHEFLATTIGQWTVSATVLLQAVGLVWMSAISRLKF